MTDEKSLKMQRGGVRRSDISMLRIASTLAVVMIHTCNTITNNPGVFNPTDFQYRMLVLFNSLANWGVPMFFMLTGVLLLSRDRALSYGKCICKYAKKVLLALLIFGIPFAWLEIFAEIRSVTVNGIIDGISRVVSGNSWGHLWYLYELIGVYLILPIIKAFTDMASRREIRNALIVLFIFNLAIQTLNGIIPAIGFYLPIKTNAVFYLMLGRHLDEEIPAVIEKNKVIILICAEIVLVIIAIFLPNNADVLVGYSSPVTAIITAEIYCMTKGKKSKMDLWKIDRLCFAVYLCHPVFTNLVYKFLKMTPLFFGKAISFGIVIFWLMFSICGFVASWVMSKISLLRKYVI